MNASMSHTHESHFGPPSNPISIPAFLSTASHIPVPPSFDHNLLPVHAEISTSIAQLKNALNSAADNPTAAAHLIAVHNDAVSAVHDAANTAPPPRKKRKRGAPADAPLPPHVAELQKYIDQIQLKCWPLPPESALLMRTSKNADYNVLTTVKKMGTGSSTSPTRLEASASMNVDDYMHTRDSLSPSLSSPAPTAAPASMSASLSTPMALLHISIHTRISWSHNYLTRTSQHVLQSSQTLQNLIDVIPCSSREIPPEKVDEDGEVVGYEGYDVHGRRADEVREGEDEGCVLCIERVAYGDGRSGDDYADKLLRQLSLRNDRRAVSKSSTSLKQTKFASLTLRINEPYWMLHCGGCEHFVVVDEISLAPSILPFPSSSYPITTYIAPPLPPLCRACTRLPASVAILGDMRLGESPSVLCTRCWRTMGEPKSRDGGNGEQEGEGEGEGVLVVPLVKWEKGWVPRGE